MTDRSNDAPGDDPVPTPDEVAEESPDLTDAEIAAATDAAADEVAEAEAGGETLEEAEAYDAEEALEAAEAEDEDEDEDEQAPARPARRLTAAEAAARRSSPGGPRHERGPKTTRTAFPIDPALRIKDPASAAFVVASIVVFLLIFLNAMAFGHGGAFTPIPTASPGRHGIARAKREPWCERQRRPLCRRDVGSVEHAVRSSGNHGALALCNTGHPRHLRRRATDGPGVCSAGATPVRASIA